MNKHKNEKDIELLRDNIKYLEGRFNEEVDMRMNDTDVEVFKSAIAALEKQIPKKVDRVGNKCPVCKCYLASELIGDKYCFNCGQAIDWSE